MNDNAKPDDSAAAGKKPLSEAAKRALKEAQDRRDAQNAATLADTTEVNGRRGPEPTRYGDWEKDGIISDF